MTSGAQGGAEKLVIYPSRAKGLLRLLGSIAFLVLCVLGGVVGLVQGSATWSVVLVLCLGVPVAVACAFLAATGVVRPRPAVELDATGITESATVGTGRLPWDEVDHVRIYRFRGQLMLAVVPRDVAGFLGRQHPLRRLHLRLNLALGCAPMSIPQAVLPMTVSELADLIHARHGVRIEAAV